MLQIMNDALMGVSREGGDTRHATAPMTSDSDVCFCAQFWYQYRDIKGEYPRVGFLLLELRMSWRFTGQGSPTTLSEAKFVTFCNLLHF
jgi:hypothetical protein